MTYPTDDTRCLPCPRRTDAAGAGQEFSGYTCIRCGKPMRYNVPRLGPNGGFVHAETLKLECADGEMLPPQTNAVQQP